LAPVEPVGTVTHSSIEIDGRTRTYRMYVPSNLPDAPVPLFVALHGASGWGDQFAATDRIERLAESNGFIVVHPDGVKVGNSQGGVWNGGNCCGVAARDGVDDVRFVKELIDKVEGDFMIDKSRVFAIGHSNGGIMSYRLACELADRIVGIGVVAGTLDVDSCTPSAPVSVIHVHGTADRTLPLAGGVSPVNGVDFPPPHDGFATLAQAASCPPATSTVIGAVTEESSAPCAAGAAATFVTIDGAGHPWPGAPAAFLPADRVAYAGFDATAEIVRFLLSHPR
jgi:polyhydroxybutyrate depolymerase